MNLLFLAHSFYDIVMVDVVEVCNIIYLKPFLKTQIILLQPLLTDFFLDEERLFYFLDSSSEQSLDK